MGCGVGRSPKDVASHSKAVYCVAFRPDGKVLASCGEDDGKVLLWDVGAGKALKSLNTEDTRTVPSSESGSVAAGAPLKFAATVTGEYEFIESHDGQTIVGTANGKDPRVSDVKLSRGLHALPAVT